METAVSLTPAATPQGQPVAPAEPDPRRARILAASIYRELRAGGMSERDVLAIATELLSQLTSDLRASREG
jgi:hypothetical protein